MALAQNHTRLSDCKIGEAVLIRGLRGVFAIGLGLLPEAEGCHCRPLEAPEAVHDPEALHFFAHGTEHGRVLLGLVLLRR